MALIDEIALSLKAGDGGSGVVRWRHEKYRPKGGPAGGNGGKGGDVRIRAVRDVGLLARYVGKTHLEAENGEDGKSSSQKGKDGQDLVLEFPVGSILTNQATGEVFDLEKEDQEEVILVGGRGGLGNEEFKSSTKQRPREATEGQKGEGALFDIELRLTADAGFVGFPNAGKSSLLNALTNAKSKVGSYEFTTLTPHLGDLYGFILADIPGLIEGAAQGKGLGHKFLRHISRTKIVIHCVSAESEDVVASYKTIRNELQSYNAELAQKPEILVLTKSDTRSDDEVQRIKQELHDVAKREVHTVSILEDDLVKHLREVITRELSLVAPKLETNH